MGRTACTEPQCLYKGDLYLYFSLPLVSVPNRCSSSLQLIRSADWPTRDLIPDSLMSDLVFATVFKPGKWLTLPAVQGLAVVPRRARGADDT